MRLMLIALFVPMIVACDRAAPEAAPGQVMEPQTAAVSQGSPAPEPEQSLARILAAQPEAVQARYVYRHPQQTLSFFGIEPGMTVVEALPGGGWYSKILLPLLGRSGQLIGADYPIDLWPLFGGFATEEFIAGKQTWATDWPAEAEQWRAPDDASISAFLFGQLPQELHGTADAVLLIRALHNLARFEDQGGFLSTVVADAFNVLKPGGILGVVQHEARPEMSDAWADGRNGYLKKSYVISQLEAAGFEYVASSNVNENPRDQPGAEDFVWRLPPTLQTSTDDDATREQMLEIGESNRMTLKFIKPSA